MKIKDFLDNAFELFWGACVQFPIILIVKWWAILVMAVCGILWRLGGTKDSSKLFRKVGVPLVLCTSAFLKYHRWQVFLAAPLMIWACPWSYGKESWLYVQMRKLTGDDEIADLVTRLILFFWYWVVFIIFLVIGGKK